LERIPKYSFISALVILLPLLLFHANCGSNEVSRIEAAVSSELRLHPASTLTDLYKFFFQDAFGPAHIISDPDAAKYYLVHELAAATRFEDYTWQALGYKQQYYRMNLAAVRNGILPLDTLLKALIESADSGPQSDIETWKAEWSKILAVIERIAPDLPNFQEDKNSIADLLAQGDYIVHHSSLYTETYEPHYRIITRDRFLDLQKKYFGDTDR